MVCVLWNKWRYDVWWLHVIVRAWFVYKLYNGIKLLWMRAPPQRRRFLCCPGGIKCFKGSSRMFWKKKKEDSDSAWKLQNKEQKENPCYRFINLQKEGILVQVFEQEGHHALEKLLQKELEPCLYNGGQGGTISKIDHIRWKNRISAKMMVSSSWILVLLDWLLPVVLVTLYWILSSPMYIFISFFSSRVQP